MFNIINLPLHSYKIFNKNRKLNMKHKLLWEEELIELKKFTENNYPAIILSKDILAGLFHSGILVMRVGFADQLFVNIDAYLHRPTPTDPQWVQ